MRLISGKEKRVRGFAQQNGALRFHPRKTAVKRSGSYRSVESRCACALCW